MEKTALTFLEICILLECKKKSFFEEEDQENVKPTEEGDATTSQMVKKCFGLTFVGSDAAAEQFRTII